VISWRALLLLAAFTLAACLGWLFWLPDLRPLRQNNPSTTAYMAIRDAQAIAKVRRPERRQIWVPLAAISDNLKHAVIISEDHMFYQHKGVNWEMTREAFRTNLKKGKLARGGSTITQQLARNLYLSPSKNPLRKLKEYLITRRLEKELSKRRILELYLNVAEWGKGIYGAQAASLAYFGHGADSLSPEEAAALAAVLPSPRRYDPLKNSPFMTRRKSTIIARMRAAGHLPDQSRAAPPEASIAEETGDAAATDREEETPEPAEED
jgi:monofunctional glycosyltransferase